MKRNVDAYILNNINPDSDGVCSAVAFQIYQKKLGKNYIPIINGEINKETDFILKKAGVNTKIKRKFNQITDVVLIDCHNILQIPHLKNHSTVKLVYDHHTDGDVSYFNNLTSFNFINRNVGAVATIIAEEILQKNLMDKQLAILLGSSIISNTLNLKAPSTKQLDVEIKDKLCSYFDLNDKSYIDALMDLKSISQGQSTYQLLVGDLKLYDRNIQNGLANSDISIDEKNIFGISQLEIINHFQFLNRTDLKKTMLKIQKEYNLFFYFLNVIDTFERKSILVYFESDDFKSKTQNGAILKSLFPLKFTNELKNFLYFNEILLRKTNLIPRLYNLFNPDLIENNVLEPYGLVFGRFQILHLGHIEYILDALQKCRHLIIGITTADKNDMSDPKSNDKRSNPLNYLERYTMIKDTLIDLGIDPSRFDIVPFIGDNLSLNDGFFPANAMVYLTIYEGWEKLQFQKISEKYRTQILWTKDVSEKPVSSSKIRDLIVNDKTWDNLVPNSVFNFIIKHKIIERIKKLYEI